MAPLIDWGEPIVSRYDIENHDPVAFYQSLNMFEFNEPYEQTDPNVIRSDFADLLATYDNDCEPLLHKLACYLPTDTLREFMDDLAMGRV